MPGEGFGVLFDITGSIGMTERRGNCHLAPFLRTVAKQSSASCFVLRADQPSFHIAPTSE
jgi:hypothetical protein